MLFIISILSVLNDRSSKQELERHKNGFFFFFYVHIQANIHHVYNKQADVDADMGLDSRTTPHKTQKQTKQDNLKTQIKETICLYCV